MLLEKNMKKLKVILSTVLFLILAVSPTFLMTGCAKHYTVTFVIKAGQGDVKEKLAGVNAYGKSIVGEYDVVEGNNLQYAIVPSVGYEIEKFYKNGVEQDFSTFEDMSYSPYMFNIREHNLIEIYFKPRTYHVTYEYWNSDQGQYVPFYYNSQKYSTDIIFGENVNIPGISAFGFTTEQPKGSETYISCPAADTFTVATDVVFRAPSGKGYAELVNLLVTG